MKRIAITLSTLLFLSVPVWSQITGPATLSVGQSGTWTLNNAATFNPYTWSPDEMLQPANANLTATSVSGGKFGANTTMTVADYPSVWFDPVANRWFAFTITRGVTPGADATLYRLDLGSDPTPLNTNAANAVTAFNLTTLGLPSSISSHGGTGVGEVVHAVVYDPSSQEWHLFWYRTGYGDQGNKFLIYRLDFGTSLANTPATATALDATATSGGGIVGGQVAQSKFVRADNGDFILFIGNRWGGPIRANFGNNIKNLTPQMGLLVTTVTHGTGVGAAVGRSSAIDVVKQDGKWYLFCSTTDASGTSGNELWRYDFGSDIGGNYTRVTGLGSLPGSNHWGLQIIPSSCGDQFYGFINSRGSIYRLNFGADLESTPTNMLIGTPSQNGLPAAADNSGLFAYIYGDSLYAVMGGAGTNGIYSMRLPYNTGNQTLTNGNSFTHTYTATGTYELTAGVNLHGGGASMYCHTVTVVQSGPPVPGTYSAAPTPVCQGQQTVLYTVPTVSGATAYHWHYTGSGATYTSSTTTSSNVLSFSGSATAGTLRVWTVDNAGDSSFASRDTAIVVNIQPSVSINPATVTICAGQSATLTASGATTYSWSPSGGTNAAATVSPASTATYTVTGTSNGCSATASRDVTVNALPVVNISPATVEICVGESATLTASGADTYVWTPALGNAATINVSPVATTPYTAEGTNTATGCKNTAIRTVTVNPLPVTQVTVSGGITDVCAGDSVLLTASGVNYNYQWRNANAVVGTGLHYVAYTSGSYYAIATDPASGCSDTTQDVEIRVYDRPVVSLPQGDTSFCIGGLVVLDVHSQDTGLTYVWKRDEVVVPLATADFLEVDETGVYKVIVGRAAVSACEDSTNEVAVTVHDLPVVNVTWDGIELHATPGYASYQWSTGGQGIPGATDSVFTPSTNGGYSVKVIDVNGCENTSSVQNLTDVGVLNVSVLTADALDIYPNPSSGVVYIKSPVRVDVMLFTADGRLLQRITEAHQVDLGGYADGMYLLRVMDENGLPVRNERVIKK